MGTVATCISNARIRVRETDEVVYTDAQLLAFLNDYLYDIRNTLVQIESVFVYATSTITTEDGTTEYTPSFSHEGFLYNGVWVDGRSTFLNEVMEADKIKFDVGSTKAEPQYYYITEDNKVGFLHTPDDEYTVYIQYWKPLTELTDVDNDDFPWKGIWNRVLERLLAFDMLDAQSRDSTLQAVMASELAKGALNATFKYGTRPRKAISNMFTIRGL